MDETNGSFKVTPEVLYHQLRTVEAQVVQLRIDTAVNKVKASAWGAVGGIATSLLALATAALT